MDLTISQEMIDGKAARIYTLDLSSLVVDLVITAWAESHATVKGTLRSLCQEVGDIGNGRQVRARASMRHVACFFIAASFVQLLEIDRQVISVLEKYLGQPMVYTYALDAQPVR